MSTMYSTHPATAGPGGPTGVPTPAGCQGGTTSREGEAGCAKPPSATAATGQRRPRRPDRWARSAAADRPCGPPPAGGAGVDSAGPAGARTLAWRAPQVAAAGLAGDVLTTQVGLPQAGLVGLAVAALVGWRLRFRPSEQARTWQRGAAGERHTARLLDRLTRDGFVVFHDLAVPGNTRANVDHLAIGPTGVFVIDSKQWTGQVHQSVDGLAWHN